MSLVTPWFLLLGWFAMAAFIVMLMTPANNASGFSANARTTAGTVIAKEPTNHATVRASYEVSGATFTVADSFIGSPNPTFDAVRVGDTVTVFYDPAAPATAVLSKPRARSVNEIGFTILLAVLAPSIFIGALWLTFRSRPRLAR
jgi:hypothetical protein